MIRIAPAQNPPKTPRELRLALHVLLLVVVVRVLLPRVKLKTIVRWLTPRRPTYSRNLHELRLAVRYADSLLSRVPAVNRGDCLPRSLVIYYFAAREGLPVQLHCGIRRNGTGLQGHVWVTVDGVPSFEPDNPELTYAVAWRSPVPSWR